MSDWQRWREARVAAATRPHGVASLDRTEWLGPDAAELRGLPGRWRLDGTAIVADGLPAGGLRLEPGEEAELDGLRVRNFDRRGNALRVFDPDSPNRTSIRGIDAYPDDPAWRIVGRFRPAAAERTVDVVAVDGVVTPARLAGEIELETPEGPATLTVTTTPVGGYSAVLGDATNGIETYRFRFVDLAGGPDGEAFLVDLNRLHLPPCAFSDQYVCPTPLPGNRWSIPVRAGERRVVRAEPSDHRERTP